jgi:hypothetical protein
MCLADLGIKDRVRMPRQSCLFHKPALESLENTRGELGSDGASAGFDPSEKYGGLRLTLCENAGVKLVSG